jgi:hypothetical protein
MAIAPQIGDIDMPQDHSNDLRYSREHWWRIESFIINYAAQHHPVTARQLFYACTVAGLVDKTELCYDKIQYRSVVLRRAGRLLFEHMVDGTRAEREPAMYASVTEAVATWLDWVRLDCWADSDAQVQIWLEKDALAAVVESVTDTYGVPLCVARGYSSITFLHDMAQRIAADGRPAYIYQFGDFDPSGQDAARAQEDGLREFAPDADITFERVAVTEQQIRDMVLPSRPTKRQDPRAAKFGDRDSVELDAIPPDDLRSIVRATIEQHLGIAEIERLAAKAKRQAAAVRVKLGM